jgi:hypothetical protein
VDVGSTRHNGGRCRHNRRRRSCCLLVHTNLRNSRGQHPLNVTEDFREAFGDSAELSRSLVFFAGLQFSRSLRRELIRRAFLRSFSAVPWPRSLLRGFPRGTFSRDLFVELSSRGLGRGSSGSGFDFGIGRLRLRLIASASAYSIDFGLERLRLRLRTPSTSGFDFGIRR